MPTTTTKCVVIVRERCQVAPPADVVSAKSHSLTYFDFVWVHFHPIQRLIFYKFPCSTSHFNETVVPSLKTSLSQTLSHYFPLAGNLHVPLNSDMPQLRYIPGDSVSFTVAEYSSEDFDINYLTGNQAREADAFHGFAPQLPEPEIHETESGSYKTISLLALQVTLFPGTGICIGFTNHHVVGDASSIVGFIKAWSTVSRLGGNFDDELLAKNVSLPIYDRSMIKDPSKRANIFWNQMKLYQPGGPPSKKLPANKIRETFILSKDDMQYLRNLVLAKKPGLTHLSSFTISTAYVWSCLAKTAAKTGEVVDKDEPEYFPIVADARHRLSPPVPAAYFGNCLALAVTGLTHGEFKGEDSFCDAVEALSKLIRERVNNMEEMLKEADDWIVKKGPLFAKRVFGVAGSPRFDLYDTDFGWGKPEKYESLSIDGESSMSLCKSREFEGGLEIGLSLAKNKMDAFEVIFHDGLKM